MPRTVEVQVYRYDELPEEKRFLARHQVRESVHEDFMIAAATIGEEFGGALVELGYDGGYFTPYTADHIFLSATLLVEEWLRAHCLPVTCEGQFLVEVRGNEHSILETKMFRAQILDFDEVGLPATIAESVKDEALAFVESYRESIRNIVPQVDDETVDAYARRSWFTSDGWLYETENSRASSD